MNINELSKYQELTGLNFVMGGDARSQCISLQNFKDLVIAEYVATHPCRESIVELPDGLPRPNERVAIVDKFGQLDFCTFITQSDGGWYWDNLVDCIYQSDEVQDWKTLEN